jgi:hypothetical protein
MAQYTIPITWSCSRDFEVEAENLQDAITEAIKEFFAENMNDYEEDSFDVVSNVLKEKYPGQAFDVSAAEDAVFD